MRWLDEVSSRFGALFRKKQRDADLADELEDHLASRIERNLGAGMPPAEAETAARVSFGGVEQIKEQCRDQHRVLGFEHASQDLRYATRVFRQNPATSIIVVLTLGFGIGINSAVFSVVDALLLKQLPVTDPTELVFVTTEGPRGTFNAQSYPLFEQFKNRSKTLSAVIATGLPVSRRLLASDLGATETEDVLTSAVSGNYFSALGVSALRGRMLTPEDDDPASPPAAVISQDYWERRFAADPSVLGKSLTVDDAAFTVVGIISSPFSGVELGSDIDVWFPIQLSPLVDSDRPWRNGLTSANLAWISIFGRLRNATPLQEATGELNLIFQQQGSAVSEAQLANMSEPVRRDLFERRLVLTSGARGFSVLRERFEQPVTLLMGAVMIVLLVACLNAATVLLARGARRHREIALRTVLGASRGRIIRQLLTESMLLALAAGVLGLLVAGWSNDIFEHFFGQHDGAVELTINVRTFAATSLLAAGIGLLVGTLPALQLTRGDLSLAIKAPVNARNVKSLGLWEKPLVVAQIALSFCLVTGAILFGRTLQNLASIDTGFAYENRVLFELEPGSGYSAPERIRLYPRVAEALAAEPEIHRATFYFGGMLGAINGSRNFTIGDQEGTATSPVRLNVILAGPGFFEVTEIPILRGRSFGPDGLMRESSSPVNERPSTARRVAVVSASIVHRLFGEKDPIGQVLDANGTAFEIVGVAKDIAYSDLKEQNAGTVFLPYHQASPRNFAVTFIAEGRSGTPGAAAVQNALKVDPSLYVRDLRGFGATVERQTTQEQLMASLSLWLGAFALLVSALGLYGVMACGVVSRTREIGIRMALGGRPQDVIQMVVGNGLGLTAIGCAVGAFGALASGRFLAASLYGIPANDASTFLITASVLLATASIASFVPAFRAANIDPLTALRAE